MRREAAVVALFAGFACARVIAFASAFPFFHNIDEYRHVDRVLKYARGYRPDAVLPRVEPELADWMARYGSPEYTRKRKDSPPPMPPEEMSSVLRPLYDLKLARYRDFWSVDAQQPPLYPLVASAWYRLGTSLGLANVGALYFVRWLDGLALAALVVVSWLFLRRAYADEPAMRLGVPLWIAAYPNDFLYGVSDDSLMPLLGGVAFLLALRITATVPARTSAAALAGAAYALAMFDKSTAVLLLPVLALLALGSLLRARRAGALVPELRAWIAFALVCGLPMAIFFAHNLEVVGDATATAQKHANLRIAAVAPSQWLAHPLFHPATWPGFAAKMVRTFWRGEFGWHAAPLVLPWLDTVYVASTAVAIPLAAFACWRSTRPAFARRVEIHAVVAVFVALVALAAICVVYRHTGPKSSARQFLASSRFAAWAVLPFAIAFVRGVETSCRALPTRWRSVAFWSLLGALLVVSTAGELFLSAPVFASKWNWYHLSR